MVDIVYHNTVVLQQIPTGGIFPLQAAHKNSWILEFNLLIGNSLLAWSPEWAWSRSEAWLMGRETILSMKKGPSNFSLALWFFSYI